MTLIIKKIPAIIPNKLIYRNQGGQEFYCYFSQDTINKIKENLLLNNRIKTNINHNDKIYDDVYLTEIWVKEFVEDKSVNYGYGDLPIGTLFVSYKVNNDKIWDMIKQGKLKGFSIEGFMEKQNTNKKYAQKKKKTSGTAGLDETLINWRKLSCYTSTKYRYFKRSL